MRFRVTFLTTVCLFISAAVPGSQASPPLREAMQARLEAVWKKDAVNWSRLTADGFTVVVPEGTMQTKTDRLASLKNEKPEPVHTVTREQVQQYGDAAVHRFMDGSEWVLEVWIRQNGTWRVVAAQVNLVKR